MFRVGVDIGSVSVNLVVLDESGNIIEDRYLRHKRKARQYGGGGS